MLVLIYIPLWFYLYDYKAQKKYNIGNIYIPLWFYLYVVIRFYNNNIIRIYIPLWFYLYRYLILNLAIFICIYIPLWFYLYPDNRPCIFLTDLFTFHYGSTYTIYPITCRPVKFWFTFHYGSTYTWSPGSVLLPVPDLHSTMVLLIPAPHTAQAVYSCSFTFHYGSTYTIGETRINHTKGSFTFHYGSTYTAFHNVCA